MSVPRRMPVWPQRDCSRLKICILAAMSGEVTEDHRRARLSRANLERIPHD